MSSGFSTVLVTAPDAAAANTITDAVLKNRFAACVNQVPGVKSKYWWEGKIEEASEILLIIKTRSELFDSLASCIREKHPYTVPEIISLPIDGGYAPYLTWLQDNTAKTGLPGKQAR